MFKHVNRFCTCSGNDHLFQEEGIITVFKDFDKMVDKQLSSLLCASCGYISHLTDLFQPINNKYRLSEKTMEVFLNYDLPVEVITKRIISKEAIKKKHNGYSYFY